MADNRLIQIMAAPKGLFTKTHNDDGDRVELPLLCMGLTDVGIIKFYFLEDGRVQETKEVIDRRQKRKDIDDY